MLDGRIYRTGLIIAVLALVVLAFSLRNQPAGLNPTIAPDAFNGRDALTQVNALAAADPAPAPGSIDDDNLATAVRQNLAGAGFTVSTNTFAAQTVAGTRTVENVVGVRPGMKSGSIVLVAPRDGRGGPDGLSGTATLLELARDLSGETLNRSVVLASISGTQGGAGVLQLARTLPQPVDAVLVLGDLGRAHARPPVVIPWTAGQAVAPPQLRNTVASALAAQTPFTASGIGLGGQFAHLAVPFSPGPQGPLGARGIPAIDLTLSGEAGRPTAAPVDPATLTDMGRAALEMISALDNGPAVAAPSAYLILDGKVVPSWGLALFALGLLVPVALTTIDAVARARRRGYLVGRSVTVVLAAALPFLAAVVVVLIARLAGLVSTAPPGPVDPGAIPLGGGGVAAIVVAALAMAGGGVAAAVAARRMTPARRPRHRPSARPGARAAAAEDTSGTEGVVVGLLVVACALTFLVWLGNPYAALLLMPALHLWLVALNPDLRLPPAARAGLVLLGVAPVAIVIFYYANGLGYGPIGVAWQAVLLIAGHGVGLVAALVWSVALGCLLSAAALGLRLGRRPEPEPAPVTVRGPITYAGPGSLGGTKSALRR